ncbi:LacI family DNA-binding transcriptional regulator [Asticcacaulis sp. AC402]|uniref:LacI family DNA-binding transcriptional regulator n=1 Tax=Asticcacaulis sp. AC402 TaxID=1282361 RepID=UPI0003C3B499|nr:LacI family DNA-binding transcriptional regulator [Asticcacaulis sp. AC402]ESQ77242.1 LacI family transcription regulator [Asticcacaulis sp. AC402]
MTRPSQPRTPVTTGREPGDLMTDHVSGDRMNGDRMSGDPVEEFMKRRKKATINDVASLAQVSKKTVSRVINNSPSVRGETRDLVNDIIARIGFRPDPQARGLAFRKSFLIGLIYDNPNAQYIVNMQMGALDGLRGSGNELVVHPCDWKGEDFLDEIRDFVELQRLSGVIILPPVAEDRNLLALLDELDVPFIRVTARSGDVNDPPIAGLQIVSVDRVGCEQAGEHLVELGHRRIAFIAGNSLYPSAHARRAGFEQGLAKHGLGFAPDLIEQGDYSFDSGFVAASKILSRVDRPTAIICCNDDMAAGAYKVAYELGLRVPDDLTIVGFDDAPIAARLNPALTTVRLPTRDMARTASEKLIGSDAKPGASVVFDSVLIVRGSSGPVPK